MVVHREARIQTKRPNEAWRLDFIHDELSNGQKFRALRVVDIFTREGLAIEVGHRLRGENVVEVFNMLVRLRSAAKYLFAQITGRSLPANLLIFGPIISEHGLIFLGQASQQIMPSSKPSTERCGTSASTSIGLDQSTKQNG